MRDHTSGFGHNENVKMPPLPTRRQTVVQKQGELEKMVKDHIADFSLFKTQVMDMFAHQRQVHEVLHRSLVQLAQKDKGIPVVMPSLPACPV